MPGTILLIRHAEKPSTEGRPPLGVTLEGAQDIRSLTVRGWIRAGGLATLFGNDQGRPAELVRPDTIYASSPDGPSRRPLETIMPLAATLRLKPNASFTRGDEESLAAHVLEQNGNVLICWQHEQIPIIAGYLIGADAVDGPLPELWPDDCFEAIWILARMGARRWRFTLLAQDFLREEALQLV